MRYFNREFLHKILAAPIYPLPAARMQMNVDICTMTSTRLQDERIAELLDGTEPVMRSNGGSAGANRNSLIVFQFVAIDGSWAQSRLPVCRCSCWESNFSLGQRDTG